MGLGESNHIGERGYRRKLRTLEGRGKRGKAEKRRRWYRVDAN